MSTLTRFSNLTDEQFDQLQVHFQEELQRRKRNPVRREEEQSSRRARMDAPVTSWLCEKYSFFRECSRIFPDLLQTQQDQTSTPYFLIQGSVQGGKTPVIAGLSLFLIKQMQISVITVVRNHLADRQQLDDKFTCNQEPFHVFHEDVKVYKPRDNLYTFNQKERGLTIALENKIQLQKIVETLGATHDPDRFALIVDEADAIAFKGAKRKPTCPQVIRWLKSLQAKAQLVVYVTATSFDVLYLEHKLTNRQIYTIPKDPHYKGIKDVQFNPVEMDLQYRKGQPISPELLEWYVDLSRESPFERAVKEDNGEMTDHPIICLQKTETDTRKQKDILCALASEPRLRNRFAILVYNGKGVDAYFRDLLPEYIPEQPKLPKGIHIIDPQYNIATRWYRKASIRDVLRMLRLYRNEYPVTHIIIIAGFTVARGLNIVSRLDYKWHLTHEIMYHSKGATVSDLMQSLRILGIYRDDIPLKVFCNTIDAEAILQAYELQDHLINGASLETATMTMPSLCQAIRVYVGLIPKKRDTTQKCAEPLWNTVESKAEAEQDDVAVHDGSSRIFRVLPECLGEVSRAYYDKIVAYLRNTQRTRRWLLKADVLSMIYREIQERNVIKSSIWQWTAQSNFFEHAETEWESGLLIRQDETGAWYMRLNEEEH